MNAATLNLMARTRIKICGVCDVETAIAAVAAGADAIGLVFVDASPRCITIEHARPIVAALPPFVEPVALFVNAPLDQVRQVAKALGLRTVQLHGDESPGFASDLAPLRVIKAVGFEARHVTESLKPWRGSCANLSGVLFDAPPADGPKPAAPNPLTGGTGRPLDWSGLAKLEHAGVLTGLPPTILAGGLNPDNVAQAIRTVEPYAVDVSSGLESSQGVKDVHLIRTFVKAVRQADEQLSAAGAR